MSSEINEFSEPGKFGKPGELREFGKPSGPRRPIEVVELREFGEPRWPGELGELSNFCRPKESGESGEPGGFSEPKVWFGEFITLSLQNGQCMHFKLHLPVILKLHNKGFLLPFAALLFTANFAR